MWAVSQDFLDSIPTSHTVKTTATVTAGTETVELAVVSGSLSVQSGSNVRRSTTLVVSGGETINAAFDLVSQDGAVLTVEHGISWGSREELVPVFTGKLSRAALKGGDGVITLSAADYGADLAAMIMVSPVIHSASMTRVASIIALVNDGFPGITVHVTASDTGTLGSQQVWSGSRWDAINTLATDGQMEAFFLPDGTFKIRDLPVIASPVWEARTGDGGTIESYDRTRPLDKMTNTVTVKPGTTDGTQTWTSVTVAIADPADPRYPGRFGMGNRVIEITSPTAATTTEAQAIGLNRLAQARGKTETVSTGTVSNPALEAGDVIRVTATAWQDTPTQSWVHILDSFGLDFVSGSMTQETRNVDA